MSRFKYSKAYKAREQSKELLNLHLCAAIDLRLQLKTALWNVRGHGFMSIHRLLDQIAKSVLGYEDLLAERINTLGGEPKGSVQMAASKTFLDPYQIGISTEVKHALAIVKSLTVFGKSVASALWVVTTNQDFATSDLFSLISRNTDSAIWRLRNFTDINIDGYSFDTVNCDEVFNPNISKANHSSNSELGIFHEAHN